MSSIDLIYELLKAQLQRLQTEVSPPIELDIVDQKGMILKPNVRDPFLRVGIQPNESSWQPVNTTHELLIGLFTVTVVFPSRFEGIQQPSAIADAVKRLYKQGDVFFGDGVKVKIPRQTRVVPMVNDPVWPSIPVIVAYSSMNLA